MCVFVGMFGAEGVLKKLPPIRNSLHLTGGFKKKFSASFSCTLAPGLAFFPMFLKKQFQIALDVLAKCLFSHLLSHFSSIQLRASTVAVVTTVSSQQEDPEFSSTTSPGPYMFGWVLFRYCGFLPQSKDTLLVLTGDSKS